MAGQMDLMPHQVMHLLALGMEERTLDKKTVWLCASCYTCATRCPNDIDITAVMDYLRHHAIEQGIKCPIPEIYDFHNVFLKDLARRGKIHEVRMMAGYNLRIKKPLKNALLAPKMFLKGRLKLKPPRKVKGFKKWLNSTRETTI